MNQIINYYNEIATTYDESRFNNTYGEFIDAQERKILDQLLSNQKGVILDLACGSGRLLNYATIGVDGSSEMIKIAKEKFPEKEIFGADATQIPLENNSVDAIISFHFLMHLNQEKIEAILKEAHRILKKGGRFIFDIPSKKRRARTNYKAGAWHGAYSSSIADLALMSKDLFEIKRTYGLLFLPIHRFSKNNRKKLLKLDYSLSNSWLKEYSSYLVLEFQKI